MENIKITSDNENYKNDYMEMVRAFNPYNDEDAENALEIKIHHEENYNFLEIVIFSRIFHNTFTAEMQNSAFKNMFGRDYVITSITGLGMCRVFRNVVINSGDIMRARANAKRTAKLVIYEELSELNGINLPYGSLTGIRPTKLYRETNEDKAFFRDTLHVSEEKLSLIHNIVELQRKYYVVDDNVVDVFINIPFCTTRCSYCSFISAEIGRVIKFIPEYVDCVVKEINDVKRIIAYNNYKVRAVYIGGGTPTSLEDKYFEKILKECDFGAEEFTVEAGRPDSITKTKLEIMKDCGVTRISINPQSFNEKTLSVIGRNHTIQEIYDVFNEARGYDFAINMDLIAMLPGEDLDDFKFSVDEAIRLNPNNITVHTLALKKGSKLRESNYEQNMSSLAEQMVHYSREALQMAGYKPYYMYRQKYMSGNLENTGYTKGEDVCLYNIDIMEESLSIIASGAGGISKRTFSSEHRLERLANAKGLSVYLERIDGQIEKKFDFFKAK